MPAPLKASHQDIEAKMVAAVASGLTPFTVHDVHGFVISRTSEVDVVSGRCSPTSPWPCEL